MPNPYLRWLYHAALNVKSEWKGNYSYSGVGALSRCILSTFRLDYGNPDLRNGKRKHTTSECITFSIIPGLTFLSSRVTSAAMNGQMRVILGDYSGGLTYLNRFMGETEIYPYLNRTHGEKLDLFIQKICRAEFILLTDDDIFFLDSEPWKWAMDQFQDPKTAVVSFIPKERFTWNINGIEYQPMGSYSLVIRRSTWIKEKLSFRTVHKPSPNPLSYQGEYGTADYANLELIRRGYNISVAPKALRNHMIILKGISGRTKYILKNPDERLLSGKWYTPEQLLYVICYLKGFGEFTKKQFPDFPRERFVHWEEILQAEQIVKSAVDTQSQQQIEGEVNQTVGKLERVFTLGL